MPELSAIALGLNGGCCFAYAVLFGLMQNSSSRCTESRCDTPQRRSPQLPTESIQQQRIP